MPPEFLIFLDYCSVIKTRMPIILSRIFSKDVNSIFCKARIANLDVKSRSKNQEQLIEIYI